MRYETEDEQVSSSDTPKTAGVTMADVETEEVTWLWERRIPSGKITLLEGDPDNGKSLITMDLAARVSRGTLDILGTVGPLGTVDGVVILNAEDGLGDTVRPRLDAAGADLTKIRAIHPIKTDNTLFRIPDDIDLLEREIEYVDAGLVIIDPLSAFMKGDPNKDNEVRKALTPLADMASRTGVAVVVVRHFNKNVDTKALYRGGGSIGIIGAARSALAVAKHPNDDDANVLVAQKGNLSRKADTLSYTIGEADNGAPCILWGDIVNLNADEVLTGDTRVSEEARARVWLETYLEDGPKPSKNVTKDAEVEGIAERTLKRAKSGIARSYRDGVVWMMALVHQEGQGCQESQERQGGTVEGDDTPDSSVTDLTDRLMAVS
jgi:archaellum biogenesis ATPase FlaH